MRGLLRPAALHPDRSSDDRVADLRRPVTPPLELRVEVRRELERVDPDALPERLLADVVLCVRRVEMAVGAKRNGFGIIRFRPDPGVDVSARGVRISDMSRLTRRRASAGRAGVRPHELQKLLIVDARNALPNGHRQHLPQAVSLAPGRSSPERVVQGSRCRNTGREEGMEWCRALSR